MRLPEPDPLDDDFPLGDGTADMDADVVCPYCAEAATIAIDPGGGELQSYVEDCPVCCQPWQVTLEFAADGHAHVELNALDD